MARQLLQTKPGICAARAPEENRERRTTLLRTDKGERHKGDRDEETAGAAAATRADKTEGCGAASGWGHLGVGEPDRQTEQGGGGVVGVKMKGDEPDGGKWAPMGGSARGRRRIEKDGRERERWRG